MPDPRDPFRHPHQPNVTVVGAPPGVEVPQAAIEHLSCPDCLADLTFEWLAGPDATGHTAWKPTISHDETCPIMQARARRNPPDSKGPPG